MTFLGLTFSEILSILTILGGIVGVYVSLNVRIKAMEIRVDQNEILRTEKDKKDETTSIENREDHKAILDKIDKLLEKL